MATCQRCGAVLSADGSFCPNCGAPVQAVPEATQPQSAQQSYGDTAQPGYYTQPLYGTPAPAYPYGGYCGSYGPVQAVMDPYSGASVTVYNGQNYPVQYAQYVQPQGIPVQPEASAQPPVTQPAEQPMAQPAMQSQFAAQHTAVQPPVVQPAQPEAPEEEPAPDVEPNSPDGRALAKAAPVEFALKADKVGIPVFFGCGYDPNSLESTYRAYDEIYRAMGIEAQMSAQMSAQMAAEIDVYKMAYKEMLSLMPKPEEQPAPQTQPMPAAWWPYGTSPYAPAESAQAEPENAEVEQTYDELEGDEVGTDPEAAQADAIATKEQKRADRLKKREEKKALRKISAFD